MKKILAVLVILLFAFYGMKQGLMRRAVNETVQYSESSGGEQILRLERTAFDNYPVQLSAQQSAFVFKGYQITPLASFAVHARVLSRERYRFGREADLSPVDFALGWGKMANPAVYQQLSISQSHRWYHYAWQNVPPIPLTEIIRSSSNMHMIPANDDVEQMLLRVDDDQMVSIRGWLVRVDHSDGWHWVSSLSREDSGNGACEVVFVQSVSVEN